MDRKNSLILGLIRKLTEYGDYPHDISPDAVKAIFSENEDLPAENFINQTNRDFYEYAYEKICADRESLQNTFSEYNIITFGDVNSYKNVIYVTPKTGLVLLFAACYKGSIQPAILMSLFIRLMIEKIFETPAANEKNKYRTESFTEKTEELFSQAEQWNYELALCAIEPLWAKMTFYTNSIAMYYCSKESLSASAVGSDYTSTKTQHNKNFRTFNIDYIKNSTFYLPAFALEKDSSLRNFIFNFREQLPQISKLELQKQQKEIRKIFRSASAEQQKNFTGNSMLIFKM